MKHSKYYHFLIYATAIVWTMVAVAGVLAAGDATTIAASATILSPTPFFRYPVVPNAPVSGYFDHNPARYSVEFFDGSTNPQNSGYTFTCPEVANDFVGCEYLTSSGQICPKTKELWYDAHTGTDFEYSFDWHTGTSCNLSSFSDVTKQVYAAAAGRVTEVTFNEFNGNYIRILHDLDGNGVDAGDIRSVYLHFAPGGINLNIVKVGAWISEGQLLGTGGMTGKAYTPHLHFEVQRYFPGQSIPWGATDPFGWDATIGDPSPIDHYLLWKYEMYSPMLEK